LISLDLARSLKEAGLIWVPQNHDYFAIPERGLDDKIFVISDIQSFTELRHGRQVVTFHGTAEWALDYLVTTEVIWLPRADQLLNAIWDLLKFAGLLSERQEKGVVRADDPDPFISLESMPDGNRCTLHYSGMAFAFESENLSEVYGLVLLHLLKKFD
jgi:hypothetical protein